jgi:hypothetical protein
MTVDNRIRSNRALALLLVAGMLAACSPKGSGGGDTQAPALGPAAGPDSYRLTATVQDLMEGIVDPSADILWDSVAYIASTKGVEDRQPRTEEEWKRVRYAALTLIEATNLLSMPGRKISLATARSATEPPPAGLGELSQPEIQNRMDSSHAAFVQFARNLQDAGLKALASIDAKDAAGLMEAGGGIDEACEACHVTYWYPNQNRAGN